MRIIETNPLDKARELGLAISQSKEYLALRKAEADFQDNKNATHLLEELNTKKKEYSSLSFKDANADNITSLKNEISELQNKIEHNTIIQNLSNAQKEYNNLIKNVNNIIDYITGNEKKNCSSNKCGSCSCSNR